MNLPNPFEFESAPNNAEKTVVVSGANSFDAAAVEFNSVLMPSCTDTVAANVRPAPEAATVLIPESAAVLPALEPAPNTAGIVGPPPMPAAFSIDDTQYIPELFSDYAHRRSMPIVSPPIKQTRREFTPDFYALYAALDVHPRDLDDDPPPLFLRSESFLSHEQSRSLVHALLHLAGLNLGSDRISNQRNRNGQCDQNQFVHRSHSGSSNRNKQLRA